MNSNNTSVTRKSRATEAFFGRRKGPQLKARKQRLYDELLPKLVLDPDAPAVTDIATLFERPMGAFRLEIGFGGGEHLAAQGEEYPDTGFIGVEPFINGMAKMLGEIDTRSLTNMRLYDDDATRILDWLPAECVGRVDLLYPDPWPKKRHWKRRFVNQKNLDRIARILKPGGEFRFASDIETYVNWTLAHCQRHAGLNWTAKNAGDWRNPWDGWLRTRYEAKAIREGRQPAYLIFEKNGNS
jgi:tRNA (guanine-N7-)-methyltransferase